MAYMSETYYVFVSPEEVVIDGYSDKHALLTLQVCDEDSVRILREASRAGCSEMCREDVVSTISSLVRGAGVVQDTHGPYVTFCVPGQKTVKVRHSALREVFFHRLLSREVMCS
jgi:hypothetical protein